MSVNRNLDPFGEHSDEELNRVLVRVRLSSVRDAQAQALAAELDIDTMLAEGGGNLSAGQRQLLAMARVLLRRNTIVIADEATASVE